MTDQASAELKAETTKLVRVIRR